MLALVLISLLVNSIALAVVLRRSSTRDLSLTLKRCERTLDILCVSQADIVAQLTKMTYDVEGTLRLQGLANILSEERAMLLEQMRDLLSARN